MSFSPVQAKEDGYKVEAYWPDPNTGEEWAETKLLGQSLYDANLFLLESPKDSTKYIKRGVSGIRNLNPKNKVPEELKPVQQKLRELEKEHNKTINLRLFEDGSGEFVDTFDRDVVSFRSWAQLSEILGLSNSSSYKTPKLPCGYKLKYPEPRVPQKDELFIVAWKDDPTPSYFYGKPEVAFADELNNVITKQYKRWIVEKI